MGRQVRLGLLQQIRTGKDVEEIDRLGLASPPVDLASVLLVATFDITINQGWPRGWWVGCLVANILSTPAGLLFAFQHLRITYESRESLSKCPLELGAKQVGIVPSLIMTCRLHGIAVYTYLVDVLQRLRSPA